MWANGERCFPFGFPLRPLTLAEDVLAVASSRGRSPRHPRRCRGSPSRSRARRRFRSLGRGGLAVVRRPTVSPVWTHLTAAGAVQSSGWGTVPDRSSASDCCPLTCGQPGLSRGRERLPLWRQVGTRVGAITDRLLFTPPLALGIGSLPFFRIVRLADFVQINVPDPPPVYPNEHFEPTPRHPPDPSRHHNAKRLLRFL